ncbi:MAG TPA: hypothetical protein VK165_04170 [Azonexus sp.]|nr:hypothetical protein [Azonexus sp.]
MKQRVVPPLAKLLSVGVLSLSVAQSFAATPVVDALASGNLGLYGAADFRLSDGDCRDCPTPPQALWYFRGDRLAVPTAQTAGFDAKLRAQDDVRQWQAKRQGQPEGTRPSLLWIGSPQVARGSFAASGDALQSAAGKELPFAVVPKIASNLSYYNEASQKYFAGRSIKARGTLHGERFVARTLWPEDFALNAALPAKPLAAGESLSRLVRADGGGASLPLDSWLLWSRSGAAPELPGKPVMAFVLNGAQGDDDEAHGGHFAVATGRFGPQGEWDDWLVNNFYNLDSVSEKGIIAATLPMDAYQTDLNSGQSWYRPSYMLVAVFKDGRVPSLYQEAIGRVFNHFYRHDFRYNHATANCAGINLETLRSLGWMIPEQGPGSRLKAVAALPYMAIKERSLEQGRKAYDYLAAEKTDLYPFVAFTAVGEDILQRIVANPATATPYEKMLAEDIEALLYVRIPQFPSSRAMGQAPVASLDEFMARTPEDRSQWKIVPTDPRPFPAELKDPAAPDEEALPSQYALAGYTGFFAFLGLGGMHIKRRRTQRNNGEQA